MSALEEAEAERIEWVRRGERAEALNEEFKEKLAEAERQRDEAKELKAILPIHGCLTGDCPHDNANQCVEALKEYVAQMEQAELELQAERDQLIKVVDIARKLDAIKTKCVCQENLPCVRCDNEISLHDALSLLPHVQVKKGNK